MWQEGEETMSHKDVFTEKRATLTVLVAQMVVNSLSLWKRRGRRVAGLVLCYLRRVLKVVMSEISFSPSTFDSGRCVLGRRDTKQHI